MRCVIGYFAICVLLSACGGGMFEKYYQGQPDPRTSPYYDSSYAVSDNVPIYLTNDMQADIAKMVTAGYAVVGESSFYGPDNKVSADDLRDFAKKLGAHAVLFHTSYRDTISGAVPLNLPTTSTSYTSGTATAYGSGGYANAYGNSQTTTYGSQTVMMPWSQSRSNFDAVYFVKVHTRLGIYVASLSDSERQELGTNHASRVIVVVRDSPAYNADVLPGDFLRSLNGQPIPDTKSLTTLLDEYEGQDVTLALIRSGKEITKKVHVIPAPQPQETSVQAQATQSGTSTSATDQTVSYATVVVEDTGDDAKNLAIASKTCTSLGKMAKKDQVRDNGTIVYLCVDK